MKALISKRKQKLLVSKWLQSNTTKTAFCRENGLATSTFHAWFKKFSPHKYKGNEANEESNHAQHQDFVPLKVEKTVNSQKQHIIIKTSSGAIVRIPL